MAGKIPKPPAAPTATARPAAAATRSAKPPVTANPLGPKVPPKVGAKPPVRVQPETPPGPGPVKGPVGASAGAAKPPGLGRRVAGNVAGTTLGVGTVAGIYTGKDKLFPGVRSSLPAFIPPEMVEELRQLDPADAVSLQNEVNGHATHLMQTDIPEEEAWAQAWQAVKGRWGALQPQPSPQVQQGQAAAQQLPPGSAGPQGAPGAQLPPGYLERNQSFAQAAARAGVDPMQFATGEPMADSMISIALESGDIETAKRMRDSHMERNSPGAQGAPEPALGAPMPEPSSDLQAGMDAGGAVAGMPEDPTGAAGQQGAPGQQLPPGSAGPQGAPGAHLPPGYLERNQSFAQAAARAGVDPLEFATGNPISDSIIAMRMESGDIEGAMRARDGTAVQPSGAEGAPEPAPGVPGPAPSSDLQAGTDAGGAAAGMPEDPGTAGQQGAPGQQQAPPGPDPTMPMRPSYPGYSNMDKFTMEPQALTALTDDLNGGKVTDQQQMTEGVTTVLVNKFRPKAQWMVDNGQAENLEQAMGALMEPFGTIGMEDMEAANEMLGPEGVADGVETAVKQHGGDPSDPNVIEQAIDWFMKQSTADKIGMAAGLFTTVMAGINAMMGGNGWVSLIMGALGIGGMAAGGTGVLGDMFGGEATPEGAPAQPAQAPAPAQAPEGSFATPVPETQPVPGMDAGAPTAGVPQLAPSSEPGTSAATNSAATGDPAKSPEMSMGAGAAGASMGVPMLDQAWSDKQITAREGQQLMRDPQARAAIMKMPPEQVDPMLASYAKNSPEFAKKMKSIKGSPRSAMKVMMGAKGKTVNLGPGNWFASEKERMGQGMSQQQADWMAARARNYRG